MKIAYIDKAFQQQSLEIIDEANSIIEEFQSDGYDLTLRQLYYQFVARGIIPNKQSEYKRLGSIINNGRLAGLIDWSAIEDRTRSLKGNQHWKNPGEIVRAAARGFMLNRWEGQETYVEVWVEKEALVGVVARICQELDVSYFACKGYVSQSEMWSAAQRMENYPHAVIVHLGDHDPSGIDMTRDIEDRQKLFIDGTYTNIEIERIALNMDQVEQYSPPPNPAKLTDSRYTGYMAKFGNKSWELDALEPRVMRELIEKTVTWYRDDEIYREVLEKEKEYSAILQRVEAGWETL